MAAAQRGAGPSSSAARDGLIFGHAFLQAVMQRGFMLETEAKEMHKRICNITSETATDEDYYQFVSDVNKRLDIANFELRRLRFPGNGKEYVGFVNKEADEPSKMAARHRGKDGKADIRVAAYFRALASHITRMDRIAFQEDAPGGLGFIKTGDALNLAFATPTTAPAAAPEEDGAGPSQPSAAGSNTQPAAPLQPLKLAEKESALASFVSDGWLAFHPTHSNAYILGPRACLELGPMLLSSEDLPDGTKEALEKALGYA